MTHGDSIHSTDVTHNAGDLSSANVGVYSRCLNGSSAIRQPLPTPRRGAPLTGI